MDNNTVSRVSALAGFNHFSSTGSGTAPLCLQEIPELHCYLVAAWPDTLGDVSQILMAHTGIETAPQAGQSCTGSQGSVLRVEPLKWWCFSQSIPDVGDDMALGTVVDLSHSRTHVHISGAMAREFLNRFLPLDLRPEVFTVGSVAATAMHHCGVTLWRSEEGYELFLPRGFALSLWELMLEIGQQFDVAVV